MQTPLALFGGVIEWWQIGLIVLLIGLIIFWKRYRSKNM